MGKWLDIENLNAELVNIICFLVGVLLICIGVLLPGSYKNLDVIFISIGASIIASTIVIFLSSRYLIRQRRIVEMIENWGLIGIFKTRSVMNQRADVTMKELKSELDMIAFGLRAFRNAKGDEIEEKVRKGLRIRILTVNPYSQYVAQRERDEGEVLGQIQKTILDLQNWIDRLKEISPNRDNIQLKFCDNLTIESYNRQDNYIYVGPYLYARPSQQTIAYEYKIDSIGYDYWTRYFQSLWDNENFAKEDYRGFSTSTKS